MVVQKSITGGRTKIGYLLEKKPPQNATVGKEPKAPKGPKQPTVLLCLFLQQSLGTRPWQLDGSRAHPVSTGSGICGPCSRAAQSRVEGFS